MQNSRIVVLDCETSTINNGREPTCRYYMHEYVLYPQTRGNQYTNVCIRLQQVFDSINKKPEDITTLTNRFQDLKSIFEQQDPVDANFDKHVFDNNFAQFWNDLRKLKHGKTTYDEMYKDEFTIKALSSLKVTNHWKFIQRGDKQYFYYDKPDFPRTYTHSQGTTIEHFFVENKLQRDEVVRVCFGTHILSTCILQFDIQEQKPVITEEPYYQEFRQTPRYVHSTYVEKINHLTEDQLKQSSYDISSLHKKLETILDTDKELTFVAHNAQQDRKWILQSIIDQIDYHEYLSCKTGYNHEQEIKALKDLHNRMQLAKWFCTIHGTLTADGKCAGKDDGSKHKIQQPRESNTLSAVYQKITGDQLKNHHDARTDTYACALIFCHLQKLDDRESSDYNRIRLLCSGSDATQRSTKIRKTKSLAETGRLTGRVFSHKKDMILRQYDIIIDTHILPPTFVTDENTQIGENIFLEFGGNYGEEHLNNTIVLNTGSGIRTRQHRLDQSADPIFGNLGGACIEFQLKDDTDGRRVEISTSCNYLLWGTHRDLLQDDLFPDQKYPIDWDTPYYLYELHTQQTMCLLVKDRVPRASINSEQTSSKFTETARLLMTLQSLCL